MHENPHRPRRRWRFSYVIGTTFLVVGTAFGKAPPLGAQSTECPPDATLRLTLVRPWHGDLEQGATQCLHLYLERGALVRVSIEKAAGALEARLLPPRDTVPALRVLVGNVNRVLSWEADESGTYTLALVGTRNVFPTLARRVRVQITEVETPAVRAARQEALRSDPRVQWLAEHAVHVRSVSPTDDDFTDLEPLRKMLDGVRLVMLGEAEHGDGSDFLAKSRLIRFLHRELAFDVLAFESGIYDMWLAGRAMQAGEAPREAFAKGAFYLWSQARQIEPLMTYIAESARSDRPLELAGFDLQFSSQTTGDTLASELAGFLREHGLSGPFAEPESEERQILEALTKFEFRMRQRPVPDSIGRIRFLRSLERTAAQIDTALSDDLARYWAKILRNTALHAGGVFSDLTGVSPEAGVIPEQLRPYCRTDACRDAEDRDPEMALNLLWLANDLYPGRKIIAWAANAHIMRNPALNESGGWASYTMGDGVWEELREASYSVGFVSLEGGTRLDSPEYPWPAWTIVRDQHPLPEFEELAAAAGYEFAFVNLRTPADEGTWLGGSFLARPIGHAVDRSVWSQNFDALFFIRNQEPREYIPPR